MKASELTANGIPVSDLYSNKISKETEVEYYTSISRMTGTGYKDLIYRIVGTDDAIKLSLNASNNGPSRTAVIYDEGYFTERRNYAKQIGKLCKEFPIIPFQVGLVLGLDRDIWLQVERKKQEWGYISEWTPICRELKCGINRRKKALLEIFEEDLYDQLHVSSMGQTNSTRLAHFFANLD